MSLRIVAGDTPRECRSTRFLEPDRLLGAHVVLDDRAQHGELAVVEHCCASLGRARVPRWHSRRGVPVYAGQRTAPRPAPPPRLHHPAPRACAPDPDAPACLAGLLPASSIWQRECRIDDTRALAGRIGAVTGRRRHAARDNLGMLIVHVHIHVVAGEVAGFLAATIENSTASLAEPGRAALRRRLGPRRPDSRGPGRGVPRQAAADAHKLDRALRHVARHGRPDDGRAPLLDEVRGGGPTEEHRWDTAAT